MGLFEETSLHFAGESFIANTWRSLYHPQTRQLIVSDCHFGKTTHFRRHSIPLPAAAAMQDYQRLHHLLQFYNPLICIFLGDLFHSELNSEWQELQNLVQHHQATEFRLIAGNHDILHADVYSGAGIYSMPGWMLNHILLSHEPSGFRPNICGHLHPGYRVHGRARQSVLMRCFIASENQLIMPSFGQLTGMVHQKKKHPDDQVLCFTDTNFFAV
ncbi:MAG: ligase-associated DNA damage response endonuclease PdeM [Bacteroidetes bacterium]|nr:ligase-associated DNA damage response endonuclease PdeM [Bacteroidota bacterium]